MGIAYHSDQGLGLTIVVGDGVVTVEDWRAHVSRMTADPEWPVGRLALTDLTHADTSALTAADVREMAAVFRRHGAKMAGRRGAIVAGETALGSASTFQQTIGPTGLVIMVFSDLYAACEWLEITVDDVSPTVEMLRRQIRSR